MHSRKRILCRLDALDLHPHRDQRSRWHICWIGYKVRRLSEERICVDIRSDDIGIHSGGHRAHRRRNVCHQQGGGDWWLFGVHFVVAAHHKSLQGTRTKCWTKGYVQRDNFSIRRCDKAICQNAKESPFSKGRLSKYFFGLRGS